MIDASIFVPETGQWRARTGKKWSRYGAEILPAWVADMDFVPMPEIRESLRVAADIADLGYPPVADRSGIPEKFSAWAQRRWNWRIDPAHVHLAPDVVGGIDNCIEALTRPGDGILVQTPIYPPFMGSVRVSGRRLVDHALLEGRIDFDSLERLVATERPRMFLLCNPHNPTGRSFNLQELRQLAALAARYELLVVSDEIHADLLYDRRRHIPFASIDEDTAARTITLNSASKSFNIAGLRLAVCHVSNPGLRERLLRLPPHRWAAYSTLGVRATNVAWSEAGEQWLAACVSHLQRMRDKLATELPSAIPGVRYRPPEATYLAWLDCRAAGFPGDPAQFVLEQAQVALSPGSDFGAPGAGHMRINFATCEAILDEILRRIGSACARMPSHR